MLRGAEGSYSSGDFRFAPSFALSPLGADPPTGAPVRLVMTLTGRRAAVSDVVATRRFARGLPISYHCDTISLHNCPDGLFETIEAQVTVEQMAKDVGRIASFINKNKSAVLFGAAFIFLLASIISMFLGNTAITVVFVVGTVGIFFMAAQGPIEYLKFGNLEMKVRRVEQASNEAKALTKLIVEIAIPLAHHSTGWAATASSTIKTKDLVLPRAMEMAEQLGVEISPEIKELDYYKTCQEYVNLIIHLRATNNERMQIISKLKNRNIATSINDVESPGDFRQIIEELGFMNDIVSQYLNDFQYYHENRKHKSMERWFQRAEWSNDNAEPSESLQ